MNVVSHRDVELPVQEVNLTAQYPPHNLELVLISLNGFEINYQNVPVHNSNTKIDTNDASLSHWSSHNLILIPQKKKKKISSDSRLTQLIFTF